MNVYLAGKVNNYCWRHQYVKGLRAAVFVNSKWPVLKNAIFKGVHYCGPFFVSCDHGCYHGDSSHGCGGEMMDRRQDEYGGHYVPCIGESDSAENVFNNCMDAIRVADIVVANIEPTAYGTITEIGFAYALKKKIAIVTENKDADLWFPTRCGQVFKTVEDVLSQLKQHSDDLAAIDECESPIEKQLLKALQKRGVRNLIPQVKAGHYRLDLADESIKFAIEVDGHAYHSSKEQIRRDNERQRYLEINGWRMHRFSGSEIFEDADNCARECKMLMDIRKREMICQ